jgi:hypothetical protein
MHVGNTEQFNRLCTTMTAKDRAMLDERIKRTNKPRPTIVTQQPAPVAGGVRGRQPTTGAAGSSGQMNGDYHAVNGDAHGTHHTSRRSRDKSVGRSNPNLNNNNTMFQLDLESVCRRTERVLDVRAQVLPPHPGDERHSIASRLQLHDLSEVYALMRQPVVFPALRTRGMLTQQERLAALSARSAGTMIDSTASSIHGMSCAVCRCSYITGALPSSFGRTMSVSSVVGGDPTSALLDTVIGQVHSNHLSTSVQAVVQLNELLADGTKVHMLAGKVDQVLMAVYFQLGLVINTHVHDDTIGHEQITKLYQSVVALLLTVCAILCMHACTVQMVSNEWLVREASEQSLKGVVSQLLTALLEPRIAQMPSGTQVVRSINMIAVKLVEGAEPTAVLVALMRLLRETIASPTANKRFIDLVMKCMWKQTRRIESIAYELRCSPILTEAHAFLVAFPVASWRQRENDTPLRTIKTILNSLCRAIGDPVGEGVTYGV